MKQEHQQMILSLLKITLTFGLVDLNMFVNQTIILKQIIRNKKKLTFCAGQQYAIDAKENQQNRLHNLQEGAQDRAHVSQASHPSGTCPRCPEQ